MNENWTKDYPTHEVSSLFSKDNNRESKDTRGKCPSHHYLNDEDCSIDLVQVNQMPNVQKSECIADTREQKRVIIMMLFPPPQFSLSRAVSQ